MKLGIIGAGSWGTALAFAAHEAGTEVMIYGRDNDVVSEINHENKNTKYAGDTTLEFKATNNLGQVGNFSDILMMATPLKFSRGVLEDLKQRGIKPRVIINTAKGFEPKTGNLPHQVINQVFPDAIAVTLSGPSHAESLIKRGYTAVALFSEDIATAKSLKDMFITPYFRIYTSTDITGAEIYGAAKNVYSIGAGLLDAINVTDNTKAAFITRALHELNGLGKSFGADTETIFSLAGVGDLVVTAFSTNSRNYSYGYSFVTGKNKPTTTVEGLNTIETLLEVAKEKNIEMPIADMINNVIHNGLSIKDAVKALMVR